MHLAMYLAQVAFTGCLVLVFFLGSISLVFVYKLSSKEMCPYFVNSAVFDTMVVMSGPLVYVLSIIAKQSWFTEDSKACYAVEIWQSYSISGSLLSWMLLAWIHRKKTNGPQPRYLVRISIICSWIAPIVPCCYSVFVRSAKNKRIPWHITCLSSTVDFNYPIFDVANIILAAFICAVTARLAYLGRERVHRKYEVQRHWKRHKEVLRINSPECSTMNISDSCSTSFGIDRYSSATSLNKLPFVIPTKHLIPLKRNQPNYFTTTENNEVFDEEAAKNIPNDIMTQDMDDDIQPRCRHSGESSIAENSPNELAVQPPSGTQSPESQRDEMQNSKQEHFRVWEHGIVQSPLSTSDIREYGSSRTITTLAPSPFMSPVAAMSPIGSPPNTLCYLDFKKLNTIKWVFTSPRPLAFNKKDRESQNFRSFIYVTACLSLIGWIWLGVVFVVMTVFTGIPKELWISSTWMIYFRFPVFALLFAAHFAEEWLSMWRAAWFRLGRAPTFELTTDFENSLKAADPRAVQLQKITIFVR